MASPSLLSIIALALVLPGLVKGSSLVDSSNTTRGAITPPASLLALASSFAGDKSLDVSVLLLNSAKRTSANVLDTYPSRSGRQADVAIHGDWANLPGVSAWHFTADMDVDCDGQSVDKLCGNDQSQQVQTSFGALDAGRVPFYILPASFGKKHKELKPNALGAVICGGRILYGIFGDENGDSPEVIGEASILLARACFPSSVINGNMGHDQLDVTYIVFPTQVPTGVTKTTIDVAALKKLGDAQVRKLINALGGKKDSTSADVAEQALPVAVNAVVPPVDSCSQEAAQVKPAHINHVQIKPGHVQVKPAHSEDAQVKPAHAPKRRHLHKHRKSDW